MNAAWSVARRPRSLDAVHGDLAVVSAMKENVRSGRFGNLVLTGSTGAGKSTLGFAYLKAVGCPSTLPSGSSCDVCDVCRAFDARTLWDFHFRDCHADGDKEAIDLLLADNLRYAPQLARRHLVMLDEADGLTSGARASLLVPLQDERRPVTWVFTCIDPSTISAPLRDRCTTLRLDPPDHRTAVAFLASACRDEGIEIDPDAVALVAALSRGYRQLLQHLETVAALSGNRTITVDIVRATLRDRSAQALHYLAAFGRSDLEAQLASLDEMAVSPEETVRAVRDVLRFALRRAAR